MVKENSGAVTLATFTYDGLHRRIAKTVGSIGYHYYLSEQNQVLEERKDNGTTVTVRNELVWHPYYVDALAARWYDSAGSGSGVYYYATHDANFNVTATFTDGDSVVERYFYTPYGQVQFLDANWTALSPNISGIAQENLYTGRQLDPETGLFYCNARYYHQLLARFLGRDWIEYEAGDENLYRYVRDNPANWTDPTGEAWWNLWICDAGEAMGDWGGTCYGNFKYCDTDFERCRRIRERAANDPDFLCRTNGNCMHAGVKGSDCAVSAIKHLCEINVTVSAAACGMASPSGGGGIVFGKPITGRLPACLAEQLAMGEAQAGGGTIIMRGPFGDPLYQAAGWVKMQLVHTCPDGTKIVIHYMKNLITGATGQFQFK